MGYGACRSHANTSHLPLATGEGLGGSLVPLHSFRAIPGLELSAARAEAAGSNPVRIDVKGKCRPRYHAPPGVEEDGKSDHVQEEESHGVP